MKTIAVVIVLFLPLATLFASQDTVGVRDPIFKTLETFIEDSTDLDPERAVLKIEYDFDSDGVLDLAISNSPNLCGNAGCEWRLFLGQPSGGYIYCKQLFFNDGAIYIQPLAKGLSRVYTYTHYSAAEGSLEEYELSSHGANLITRTASDTANWGKFLRLCNGKPSPLVVFSCNVLQFLRTRQYAWVRWR
jgi:hypothetical protein